MKHLTQIFYGLVGVLALICAAVVAVGRLAWRVLRNLWGRTPRWLCVVSKIAAVGVVVGFVALCGVVAYEDNYGRDYYDRYLTDGVTLRSFADDRWRVYNEEAECYTTRRIDWLTCDREQDSLAVYACDGRRGYVDINSGRVVIAADENDYRKAWLFSEGLAAVVRGDKIGFVNVKNEVVIPFEFDYVEGYDMNGLGYLFHGGCCVMTNREGRMGLIDHSGRWVVEPVYDEIWAPQHGCRVVLRDGMYGMLDSALELRYDTVYDYVGHYGAESGIVLMRDGSMWQEDDAGCVVRSSMYEASYPLYYLVEDSNESGCYEVLSDYASYQISQRYGIMNRLTGELLTPAIYESVDMLSPTLFEVSSSDGYGYYTLQVE